MSDRPIRRIVKVMNEFCTSGEPDPQTGERPSDRRKLRHVVQAVSTNAPKLLVSFQQKSGLTQGQIKAALAGKKPKSTSTQRAGVLNFVKEIAKESGVPIPEALSQKIVELSGPASA